MELLEKINRAFGGWYEGLFGASSDVRPKDVLRKILTAMEEHRKQGFDDRIYVPNQYILEILVDDDEEKEYLLSFLEREELETAVRRYCDQNHYAIRGGLDFTIKEVERQAGVRDKVRVRCRYNREIAPPAIPKPPPPVIESPVVRREERALPREEDDPTVYGVTHSDEGTVAEVALARLEVQTDSRETYEVRLGQAPITIGRSKQSGNDIVLAHDGLASRRHARIELDADGRFTVYDLDTTNGTKVNGRKIDNRTLNDGDEIGIGASKLTFRQSLPSPRIGREAGGEGRRARLILLDGDRDVEEYVLASETVVGRGATNDIVLHDRSVATRHAIVRRAEPFSIESLDSEARTEVNGQAVDPGNPRPIKSGDEIAIGVIRFRFQGDDA